MNNSTKHFFAGVFFMTLAVFTLLFFHSCQSQDDGILKQDQRLLPYLEAIELHLESRNVTPNLTNQINIGFKDFGVIYPDFLLDPNSGAPWGKYAFNTILIDQTVYDTFIKLEMFNELEILIIHEVSHFYWFEHYKVPYTLEPLNKIGSEITDNDLNNIYDQFARDILEKYPSAEIKKGLN